MSMSSENTKRNCRKKAEAEQIPNFSAWWRNNKQASYSIFNDQKIYQSFAEALQAKEPKDIDIKRVMNLFATNPSSGKVISVYTELSANQQRGESPVKVAVLQEILCAYIAHLPEQDVLRWLNEMPLKARLTYGPSITVLRECYAEIKAGKKCLQQFIEEQLEILDTLCTKFQAAKALGIINLSPSW